MEDFFNNNPQNEEGAPDSAQNENPAAEINDAQLNNESFGVQNEYTPIFNPVTFSEVKPQEEKKPMSKGLKVFSLILALVVLITGTTVAGYFVGKNSSFFSENKVIDLDLEEIPEKSEELSPAKVYEKVNPCVVGITVYNSNGDGGQASGIVYSKDGYIVTNDHIYSEIPNPKFKIHAYDGKEYDAKYIAGDTVSDLAVLKIEGGKLSPAVFGNSDSAYMGQRVVAIGRPNDATDASSITSGIISATNRRVSNSSNYPARLIQTDSPINPGSSGGALVNMHGQVVGVTSSKLASVEYEGVGYAIPTTVMKRIVTELIKEGKVVTRAKLGITYTAINSVTAEITKYKHIGLLVASVSEDSDLYGKISENDIITKINDIAITNDDIVLDIIEKCSAGDTISVTVITSKGKTKTLKATLAANVSSSSYTTKYEDGKSDEKENSSGGTFDFPQGE